MRTTAWIRRQPMINKQDHAKDGDHHQEAAVLAHKPAGAPLAEEFDPDDGRDTNQQITRREKTGSSLLFCIPEAGDQHQDHQDDGAEQLVHTDKAPVQETAAQVFQEDLADAQMEDGGLKAAPGAAVLYAKGEQADDHGGDRFPDKDRDMRLAVLIEYGQDQIGGISRGLDIPSQAQGAQFEIFAASSKPSHTPTAPPTKQKNSGRMIRKPLQSPNSRM